MSSSMAVAEFFKPKSFDSYADWHEWATEDDQRQGKLKWRDDEKSDLYDYAAVKKRLNRLRRLRYKKDARGLLFALHEGIHGNMGGMGKSVLYAQAKTGTKVLIDSYIDEIVESINYIDKAPAKTISKKEKREFFDRANQCFGCSALMLSGGALMGWYHYGVSKALLEHDLLPDIISGSSAGSIVAGVLGTRRDNELHTLFESRRLIKDASYEAGFMNRLFRRKEQLVTARYLDEILDHLVPDLTFEEALEKTGRHINISIAPVETHQTSRLLNAITTPNVYVRSAIRASCALPGFLPAVTLKAKNFNGSSQDYLPSRQWSDGSFAEDLPIKRMARLYGVNHSIVSQVNPHVVPFIKPDREHSLLNSIVRPYGRFVGEWLRSVRKIQSAGWLPLPSAVGTALNAADSVINQKYTADINIFLDPRLISPMRLMSKPTTEEVMRLLRAGDLAKIGTNPQQHQDQPRLRRFIE